MLATVSLKTSALNLAYRLRDSTADAHVPNTDKVNLDRNAERQLVILRSDLEVLVFCAFTQRAVVVWRFLNTVLSLTVLV